VTVIRDPIRAALRHRFDEIVTNPPKISSDQRHDGCSRSRMTHELDAELARWLRVRTTLRATRNRDASALDEVATAIRRVRWTLNAMASETGETTGERDSLIARTYRWAIRVARELEAIEQLELDSMTEWTHFEAFAPFALAFFDSALAPAFAGSGTFETARLRRELDGVLSPLTIARTSSALAA